MKQKNIFIVFALLFTVSLHAQHKHELSAYGGGGLSTLNYKPATGDQSNGFGATFGLGYTFFFSPNWGVSSGLGLSLYNAKYSAGALSGKYNTTDMDGAAFDFSYTTTAYDESQRAMLFEIPLLAHFQKGANNQFYADLGFKIGLPVSATYSSSPTQLTTYGEYGFEKVRFDTQEFMGFGTFDKAAQEADLELKTAFMLSAEAGMKWRLAEKWALYTGVYFDYGLNNIQKDAGQPLVDYTKNADLPMHSAVQSQAGRQALADKITPLAAGVKVKLAFGR